MIEIEVKFKLSSEVSREGLLDALAPKPDDAQGRA